MHLMNRHLGPSAGKVGDFKNEHFVISRQVKDEFKFVLDKQNLQFIMFYTSMAK